MIYTLNEPWWKHFEGKVSTETLNSFHELSFCQYLGISIECLVEDVWDYVMFLADNGQEEEAKTISEDVQKQVERICGKIMSNADALGKIIQYIDDLEDGIYWDQLFERIEKRRNGKTE